jgi:Tol biopolymer transport system component
MSPEQARGQAVDKRSDVWAFGCVLYECLIAKQAFGGGTLSDVLASILKTEPDWPALSGRVSKRTARLLRRCLEKDSSKRLRDMGDVVIEIDELLAGDPTAAAQDEVVRPTTSRVRTAAVGVVGVAVGAALWSVIGERAAPDAQPKELRRLDITLSESPTIIDLHTSPDGRSILLMTRDGYYLRRLDEYDLHSVPDTEHVFGGVFSPDGRSIALFRITDQIRFRGKLQRVSLEGRPTLTLHESPSPLEPVAWSEDSIWVVFDDGKKLGRVPASGGEPEVFVDLSDDEDASGLRLVQVLPDGKNGLLLVGSSGSDTRTELISLETGERRVLHESAWSQYVQSGHLLALRDGTVMGLPFDLESLESRGSVVPILSGVANASVSPNGTLLYVPRTDDSARSEAQVIRASRQGEIDPVTEKMPMWFVRYSPDGRRFSTVNGDISIHDLAEGTLRPLEFGEVWASDHEWTPDGEAITYTGFGPEEGRCAIYRQALDGSATPTVMLEAEEGVDIFPTGWSPDGSVLIYSRYAEDDSDLWVLPADGSEPAPLLSTKNSEDLARFSPDGNWIAYESNESGRQEIYVRSYLPEERKVGPKWRVSNEGGRDPQWSPDGSEVYYEDFDDRLVAVQVRRAARDLKSLAIGERSVLFDFGELGVPTGSDQSYDVAPDGEHFVFVRGERTGTPNIRVVLNWFEELKRRAPSEL